MWRVRSGGKRTLRVGNIDHSPTKRDFICPRRLEPGESARRGSKWRAFRVTASTNSPRGPYFPRASPTGPSPGGEPGREGSARCARPGSQPPAPAPGTGATLGRWGEIKRGKVLQVQIREAQLRYQRLYGFSRRVCSNCLNFQSTRTPATFGKQLLIPRAESVGCICGEGKLRAGERGPNATLLPASRPRPPTATPSRGPFPPQDRQLLASAGAGVGDFRKLSPRGRRGKEGPGLLPRPRGSGGGAGQEPGRRVGPSRGEASF